MSDRLPVVYIAGPYRGLTEWAVQNNIRNAEAAMAELLKAGFAVVCPHKNSANMGGCVSDIVFLAVGLELLSRCDAVLLLPWWEQSAGATAEKQEAERLGLPVFTMIEQAVKWRDSPFKARYGPSVADPIAVREVTP